MTIDELILALEDCRDAIGGDNEVQLMTQETYPFINDIHGVALNIDLSCCKDEKKLVVFIVEGRQLGYGHKEAWDIIG